MRRIVYSVTMSLDGYIAKPGGEYDWIVIGPDLDFEEIYGRFETLLMGRRTFEAVGGRGGGREGMKTFGFSRTLRPADHPGVSLVAGATPTGSSASGAAGEARTSHQFGGRRTAGGFGAPGNRVCLRDKPRAQRGERQRPKRSPGS